MKLVKLIANLGYGSRKQVQWMFREGRVTDADGEVLYADDQVPHEAIRVDGEPLDPAVGLSIALHKPAGYTCSTKDTGRLIYDLLPPRFRDRDPVLSTVGRLDRETSGLLLLTDDGGLLHRIISPKSKLPKVYEVELSDDLRGDEVALFASGTLMLESEKTPLLPAELEVLDAPRAPGAARRPLPSGTPHVRRHRQPRAGPAPQPRRRAGPAGTGRGQWRQLTSTDLDTLFAP